MAKLTTDPVGNFNSEGLVTLNENFKKVEAALEKTLSRDGEIPNQIEADFDANHNDILNVKSLTATTITLNGHELHPEDVVIAGALLKENNLSDVDDVVAARAALDVKGLNNDGGFTFNLTGTPTNLLGPLFGSVNRTHQRFVADTNSTHSVDAGDGANTSWYAMSIVHNFLGSGGPSGGGQLDGAVWVDSQKKGWTPGTPPTHVIGEGVKGPTTTNMSRAINNEWGDTCLYSGSTNKIMVDDVPTKGTGSNLVAEWATRSYDEDGVTMTLDLHTFIGWHQVNLTGALHPGLSSGFNVRPHIGTVFSAFIASAPTGGGKFNYVLFATPDDNQANAYFAVTGNNHPAGGGIVRAAKGSVTSPTYSFLDAPSTGFYHEGGNIIAWSNNTGIKRGFFGNGFRVGTPSGGDPGAGGINIAGHFQINGVNRINSAGHHVLTNVTTADLSAAANAINTTGKAPGVIVYNTTDQKTYVANAGDATSGWYPSDGGAPIVPA